MIKLSYFYCGHEKLFESERDQITIGRPRVGANEAPDLDLTPDLTVSRPHARLWRSDGGYFIEDLGSTHGTQLNGIEIRGNGPQPLQFIDNVLVGETTLRLHDRPAADATRADETTRAVEWPRRRGQPIQRSTVTFSPATAEPQVEITSAWDAKATGAAFANASSTSTTHQLALLYELPLQFAAVTSLHDLFQLIVRRLVEVVPGASRAALVLYERATGALIPEACYPEGQQALSKTLAGRAIEERKAFVWRQTDEGAVSASVVQFQIETGMYAPLLWQEHALGVVCVDNLSLNANFTDDDLRLMVVVAQYAAMALANQQLQLDLREAWTGALEALTSALASRDNDTKTHCYRTVELAVVLARTMGLSEAQTASIARGALLHDIGKIGISDQVLLKPGPLTTAEREVIKGHVRLGHDMLKHIDFFSDALPVVLYHHEDFDGSGYPDGLCGEEIPLAARIFHVVDMYDALTHERPYKSPWTHEAALEELRRYCGMRYDPAVVAAFETLPADVTDYIRDLQAFTPTTRALLGRSE